MTEKPEADRGAIKRGKGVREDRLAAELRANLTKRKTQARARQSEQGATTFAAAGTDVARDVGHDD